MKTTGKILLDRKLLDWKWHTQPNMMSVWVHLLMLANYSQTEWKTITIERGQCIASLDWLSEFVGLSKDQLRTCLERLKKDGSLASQRHCHNTILTVCHYNKYQFSILDTTAGSHAENPAENNVDNPAGSPLTSHDDNKNNKNNNKKEIEKKEEKEKSAAVQSISKEGSVAAPKEKDVVPQTPADERRLFANRLHRDESYLSKCRIDYAFDSERDLDIRRYLRAFNEFLARERKDKRWGTYDNFCRHFHSWLRFQDKSAVIHWNKLADQRCLAIINQRIHQQILEQREREWQERLAMQDSKT